MLFPGSIVFQPIELQYSTPNRATLLFVPAKTGQIIYQMNLMCNLMTFSHDFLVIIYIYQMAGKIDTEYTPLQLIVDLPLYS